MGKTKIVNKILLSLLIGSICLLLIGGAYLLGFLDTVEFRTLDARFRWLSKQDKASEDIVIVSIDQNSLDHMKSQYRIYWKWPRDIYAYVIKYLSMAGARVIICDFDFSEPDVTLWDREPGQTDRDLAGAMQEAGNVFNIFYLVREAAVSKAGNEDTAGQKKILEEKFAIEVEGLDNLRDIPSYAKPVEPIMPVLNSVKGLGAANLFQDSDGIYRRFYLFHEQDGKVYPAMPLSVAMSLLGEERLSIDKNYRLKLGGHSIPLDKNGAFLINWYGVGGPGAGYTYKYYPMAEVLISYFKIQRNEEPLIPLPEFKDKIVLLGSNAPALFDLRPTPVTTPERPYPGVEIHASIIDNFMNGMWFVLPQNSIHVITVASVFLMAFLTSMAVFIWRRPVNGVMATLLLGVLYLVLALVLFRQRILVAVVPVELSVGIAFAGALMINYLTEGRQKRFIKESFSHYVSPEMVNEIIDNPDLLKLGGERCELSILFSDIRGFTSISEQLQPDELVAFLNEYLTPMARLVIENGGTVDKFIGDAVMAFFGAPVPEPDHPVKACRTALNMLKSLEELKAQWKSQSRPPFIQSMQIGIGINSGQVVVGNMGGKDRFDYTVIGDEVNLASRLEGINKQYGTNAVVSENTYKSVKREFFCRELDSVQVKGKNIPIKIYELMGSADGVSGELKDAAGIFVQALELYRNRRFEEAVRQFERVISLRGQDPPSKVFIERCRFLIDRMPPEDWDGVFVMASK